MEPDEFGAGARATGGENPGTGRRPGRRLYAEPIQGAGWGGHTARIPYWPEIKRILAKLRHSLLVMDEVICGFGRTGECFGSQYYDFQAWT